jgi:hypothetical protein
MKLSSLFLSSHTVTTLRGINSRYRTTSIALRLGYPSNRMLRITAGDNLFVVVTDSGTDGRRIIVRFPVAERDLSVLQLVRTGSGAVIVRMGKEW